jgi:hypothetical protein
MKKLLTLILLITFMNNMHSQVGPLQWQRALGGSAYEYMKEIDQAADGSLISAGYTESSDGNVASNHGGGDCWLMRQDPSGNPQWERTYGGSGYDYAYSVKHTADGGYICAGYSESTDGDIAFNHGAGDYFVFKTDNAGTLQWEKTYGGSGNESAQCIRPTADGGYILCGYTESSDGDVSGYHGNGDCWIIKINAAGTLSWKKTFGGSGYDYAQDIKQTTDGGYIFTGGSNSADGDVSMQHGNGDCWLVKLDAAGNLAWEKSYGGTAYDFAQSVEQTQDGGFILAGYTESSDGDVTSQHGNGDCWLIKCSSTGSIEWQKALGSSGSDYAYGIKEMAGAYAMIGYASANDGDVSGNHGDYDCWLAVLDNTGVLQSQRSFGGSGIDIGYSIRQAASGSWLVSGYSDSNDGNVSGNHGGGDSWIIRVSDVMSNVQEQAGNETVQVYPNISTGNFNFYGLQEESSLEVFDASGRLVMKKKMDAGNYSADLQHCSKGFYHYAVTGKSGKRETGKLIIQ